MTISEKIYTGLCVSFATLLVIGNVTYQKFVSLALGFHTFELSVGAILYPLTFLITDLIAEFYDKDKARFCVRFAMLINILAATILMGMDLLPATAWSKIDDVIFHRVFGFYYIAFVGSMIACYISQALDISLYLWIKKITKNRSLWLRNNGSTAISLLLDTTIVISFLSFFNILPTQKIGSLIISSYSFKLFFTVCSTPIFYGAVAAIKWLLKKNS